MEFNNSYTNLYPISKTLRFRLIPKGNTKENMLEYLERDETRNSDSIIIKELISRYDKKFISDSLSNFKLDYLSDYYETYVLKDNIRNKIISDEMRKNIHSAFENYAKTIDTSLSKICAGDIVKNIIANQDIYCESDIEKEALYKFKNLTTYFKDYCENRKNIYSAESIPSSVAYRIVNENLSIFCSNIKNGVKALELLDNNDIKDIKKNCLNDKFDVINLFEINFYNNFILQNGIDIYNKAINGYTLENGFKIKGLNELINLYNQNNKDNKISLLKTMDKQILGDKEIYSFVLEKYNNDDEVLSAIEEFYNDFILDSLKQIKNIFSNICDYDLSKIYLANDSTINSVSNEYTGSWDTFKTLISIDYDFNHNFSDTKKYQDDKNKYLKNIRGFSVEYINKLLANNESKYEDTLEGYLSKRVISLCDSIINDFNEFELLKNASNKKLQKNNELVNIIKNLLDSCKELQHMLYWFSNDDSLEIDYDFMNKILEIRNKDFYINDIYNKTRNYITKKPYSTEKIKLSFDIPTLLDGWDINKEQSNLGFLLRKDRKYYLGIMNPNNRKLFENVNEEENEDYYEKIIYKQIPNAAKYFSSKQIYPCNPPENIKKYLSKDFDKKTMSKEQLTELIQFVADEFIPNYDKLIDENGEPYFNFKYKPYNQYSSWKEFCDEIDKQAYVLKMKKIPSHYVDALINEGKLFMFELYCKDFSEAAIRNNSKKNLHTLYFESLFSEDNLKDLRFSLNGGAMMFYRKGSLSIDNTTVHSAHNPIKNKNALNKKKESIFNYDIIKDKRFTEDQFFLHFPITINPNSVNITLKNLNTKVKEDIKKSTDIHIIGIDRGERNLLYISVINEKGEIIEQKSLNIITNKYKDGCYKTDYHELLDEKEKNRLSARQNWKEIENIKDLKEGYLSVCVNEIVKLVKKYNAIVALEDLNSGFKNSRIKVEKQVYQKFEKQLIEKLNYVASKDADKLEPYGIMNGMQLSSKFESFKAMSNQNGIIFYVNPWLTSKIDPTTGFVNLLHLKYESINKAKEFISKIDSISFDGDLFKFELDYSKFGKSDISYRKKWNVYSYGKRLINYRNPEIQNRWDTNEIDLTHEYEALLNKYGIDINENIKQQLLDSDQKDLFEGFLRLLSCNLQMRNSKTGTDIDYIISPVKNSNDEFFESNNVKENLPIDADANGAYHIALKMLLLVTRIKDSNDVTKLKTAISNEEWLKFAQNRCM